MGACSSRVAHAVDPEPLAQVVCDPETVKTSAPTNEPLDLLVTALNRHLKECMYYETTSGGFTVQVTCATLANRMMHDNDYRPLVVTDANVTALLTAAGWNVRPTKHYLWATHPAPRRAVTVPALPDVHQVDGVRARSPVALAGTLVGNSRTATEYRTAAEDNKDNADPDSKRGACKDGIVFAMLAEQHI